MQLFYVKLTLYQKELFSKRGDVPTLYCRYYSEFTCRMQLRNRQVKTFGGTIYFAVDGT